MQHNSLETSAFGLAKGKALVSDDFYAVSGYGDVTVGIVCDGVGSARMGGEAARRIVNYLQKNFKQRPQSWSIEKSLERFIGNINRILYREGIDGYERPEYVSTLSIAVIRGNRLYGANVGDSPIYLLRGGTLERLTHPHAHEEPGMEHVLTRAVGLSDTVEPYLFENNLEPGDTLLICSDGLDNVLDKTVLASRLDSGASALVKFASKSVGDDLPDDTSAVVIRFGGVSAAESMKHNELPVPGRLSAGEEIDGYRLVRPLIQNERTWLAEQGGGHYVLKFPPEAAADDERLLDLFITEAWNATRLKAGFFPKAFLPEKRTMRYYVMPFIQGESLKTAIAKRPLGVEETIALGKFLLHACGYLLKFDLVHGDIKPENIIVSERNGKRVFTLVDFGSIVEIFSVISRAGTPSYLAPERFSGDPVSEQTELFAIGVTLYETLTRHYPYGEIEPFQTPVFRSAKAPRRYNQAIPEWMESVILRSIESDVTMRYERFSEMEYELSHPAKVRPYFKKGATLMERRPVLFYRTLFTVSLLLNFVLLALLLR